MKTDFRLTDADKKKLLETASRIKESSFNIERATLAMYQMGQIMRKLKPELPVNI